MPGGKIEKSILYMTMEMKPNRLHFTCIIENKTNKIYSAYSMDNTTHYVNAMGNLFYICQG